MRRKAPAHDPAVLGAVHEAARHQQAGDLAKAEAMYRQILKRHPDHPDALHLLGMVTHLMGDTGTAVGLIRRVIRRYPDFPEAHNTLGNILKDQGDTPGAVACYRKAVKLRPEHVSAHYNLGNCYRGASNLEQAAACYRRAVEIDPEYAKAHNALGGVFHDQGKGKEALAHYRRAVEIEPNYAEALNNSGITLQNLGRLEDAIACYRRAIEIDRDHASARNNLGATLMEQGNIEEAEVELRRAVQLKPDFAGAHSNLLLLMNYRGHDPHSLYQAHRAWNVQHAKPLGCDIGPWANNRDPDRRLKVGYVSPDFRLHSVSYFFEPLLECHDRDEVEVFCYADVPRPDPVTERLRGLADHWVSSVGVNDGSLARRIRTDRIDILVDLAGHTGGNRLLVFARKPAPVQVSWLGYPNTTGLDTIDYRLTDAIADPEEPTGERYSEKLFRLPECFLCYRPQDDTPNVAPLPYLAEGFVTFGSFNTLAKVTPEVIAAWAEVLHLVPNSRLLLKSKALADKATQERYMALLRERGAEAGRIELTGWLPTPAGHLDLYGRVDIGLDTFPYNGTTTTCEALWMGVPSITRAGSGHAGRVGARILKCVEFGDLVTESVDEYIATAAALAQDVGRLAKLRVELRKRVRNSVLCDKKRFAERVDSAYRKMWQHWCTSEEKYPPRADPATEP